MTQLQQWVSDELMTLTGMSASTAAASKLTASGDRTMVDFITATASKAKTPAALESALASVGLPDSTEGRIFATELFARVPRNAGAAAAGAKKAKTGSSKEDRQRAEKETAKLQAQKYSMMHDDGLDASTSASSSLARKDKGKERERSSKHPRPSSSRRQDAGDAWESDEEERAIKRRRAQERAAIEDARFGVQAAGSRGAEPDRARNDEVDDFEDPDEIKRREEEEDRRERDEFAKRMREKDKGKKSDRIVEDRSTEEARKRRDLLDDPSAISDLRNRSRQEYLAKREKQQLDLLRLEIADYEADLRAGQTLTKRERRELDDKKLKLRLVEERLKIDDHFDGYMMPDDYITEQGKMDSKRKSNALYKRYEDNKRERDQEQFVTDLDRFEALQTESSMLKTGAQDRVEIDPNEQYEYVFDEQAQINWIQDQATGLQSTMSVEEAAMQAKIAAAEAEVKSIEETRKTLPVYAWRDQLLEAVQKYQVLIVVGETGSGKTTQLPQYLHEAGITAGGLKVGCTQPRRVAAMSVAKRVADEVGCRLGDQVGYSIRFEDCTSDKTIIKYSAYDDGDSRLTPAVTDGMLLREFLTEPDLAQYAALIIDEAHERTLSTDILLGLVKDIARFRPDFRLLISSATMNAQKFSDYFDEAPIFNIPGRMFPVDVRPARETVSDAAQILYTPQPEANYLHAAVTTVFQIHTSQPKGDILVFLTGQDEIESMQESLEETCRALGSSIKEMIVAPIYATLPTEQQTKIFEPTPEGARKVVLATNIAETSITIPGIVFVIDPGFVKQNSFNPKTGVESLVVVPCSRAAANQRAGRAGRMGPGKCFRLYTKHAYLSELEEDTVPEIQRTNLAMVVLMLKSLGINDLLAFDFIDKPPDDTLIRALDLLYALGAFNDRGELTKLGRRMAELPIDPKLSRALLASEKYRCTEEVLTIVSMLQESASLFYRPKDKKMEADRARQNFVKPQGDHFTLLNLWQEWSDTAFAIAWTYENFVQIKSLNRVRDIRDQLSKLCERIEIVPEALPDSSDISAIQKSMLAGYFQNAATLSRTGDSYRQVKAGGSNAIFVHPSSCLFMTQPPTKALLFYELVLTSKEYMRQVMEIRLDWLSEVAPHYISKSEIKELAGAKGMPKKTGAVGLGEGK